MLLSPAESYTRCARALLRPLSAAIPLACMALALSGNGAQTEFEYTNRLIDSNNPYLLLHAHNPVDWYPWGPEALAKAKRENKPIFLSIGYSTCYWCHVAERTLFSNPEIAKLMNEWFVNIKVDREERPDLDAVYMLATQLLTSGAGGWPNNLFLTPDLKPFYAGGYFPPEDDELGRPGFPSVLKAMHEEWISNPERAKKRGDGVVEVLRRYQASATTHTRAAVEPKQWLASAREAILKRFDAEQGGVGSARQSTKFPQSPSLNLMLTDYQHSRNPDTLRFLTVTLDAMAYGGIYDQLGGGFHRYSTERTWSIPHFEKMLYDNAQLLSVYTRAWQLSGKPQFKRIALGVRDYLRRQMTSPEGGFYTAEDAAVDGEEGASYLWTRAEIETVLGRDTARFLGVYTLTPMPTEASALDPETIRGVLRVHRSGAGDADPVEPQLAMLDAQRHELLRARDARPQPARDEKLLVGLNGLAIEGFAISGAEFHDHEDVALARRAADRMWKLAWNNKTGRLSHQIFMGHAQGEGFLDDYALLGRGFLALYRASGDKIWLQRSRTLADALLRRFDRDKDGMLASGADTESLIVAPMEQGDEAYPSGTSAAVDLLAKLSKATGSKAYAQAAARIARQVPGAPEQWPTLVAAVNTTDLSAGVSTVRSDPAPTSAGQTAAHLRVSGAARSSAEYEEIVVTLEIEKGFHINANPASFDFLIPTRVTLAGIHPIEVRYPPPTPLRSSFAPDTLNVYEGNVQAVARLKKGSLDGLQWLKATVDAQACTETVCLPPSQIPLTVRLR